jgi:flagellar basal body rod protein FlgC
MKKLLSIAFSFGLLTSLIAGAAVFAQDETQGETVSGNIKAIDTEASTITVSYDEKETVLTATDATVIDKDGEACSLGDLEVGMEVSATYNSDTMEAVEIHATSAEEIPFEAPAW